MTTGFPGIPPLMTNEREHRRQIAGMLNERLNRGKFNCTIALTLTPSATSTTLLDERIGYGSYIDFMPQTANAATAKQSIYVAGLQKGQCTVHHASSANVDQTFTVVILG